MNKDITAIIVDDETKSRSVLRGLLTRNCSNIQVIAEASDVEEAFDLINRFNPQLVFLDIQMPHADGFNLLKKFPQVPFELIFVTSFDQYAIAAIKFSALDYLLKPVEVEDLKKAVKKAEERINSKQGNNIQVINLLKSIDNEPETHHIAIHKSDSVRLLEETVIISISADGHYCTIATDSGEKFTIAKDMRDFEDYFGKNSTFIRIGRSQMINTKKMVSYTKTDPCIIEMVNGEIFEVSRRKKSEVLALLNRV